LSRLEAVTRRALTGLTVTNLIPGWATSVIRVIRGQASSGLRNPGRHLAHATGTLQQPGHDRLDTARRDAGLFDAGPPDTRDEYMDLGRITVDHQIMGGVPCVAGTRIPVATVVGLANGLTAGDIIAEYPQLSPADVQAPAWAMLRGAIDEHARPGRW
jgi:uncharacterized protein (DUF433 family)